MRIGLNLTYLLPSIVGGTETYAAGLIQGFERIASDHEFVIFVNQEGSDWPIPDRENFLRVVCPISGANRLQRYAYEQLILPRVLRGYGVDLIHSLGYVSPIYTSCPSVVTIHDLNYRNFGKQLMPLHRYFALAVFVRLSAKRASQIIAPSEFSKTQITEAFNVPSARIHITYYASKDSLLEPPTNAEPSIILRQVGVSKPYIVAFGNNGPNKNIPRLVAAFMLAKEQYDLEHELVLIGHIDSSWVLQHVSNLNNVRFTGYLGETELRTVLTHAEFLVVPSYYEGFGFPVLEAMALGTTVVCSNASSLPEVAGDSALFFDPFSKEEMASQIGLAATSEKLRNELQRKGYENMRRFSWAKTALETLDIYKLAVNSVPMRSN